MDLPPSNTTIDKADRVVLQGRDKSIGIPVTHGVLDSLGKPPIINVSDWLASIAPSVLSGLSAGESSGLPVLQGRIFKASTVFLP